MAVCALEHLNMLDPGQEEGPPCPTDQRADQGKA